MKRSLLITIVGPTAVGKTSIAIEIAKSLDSIIISGDSRQFYRETKIGTAKPNAEQLSEIPHYFVDQLSIQEIYNVGDYEREVLAFLKEHYKTQRVAILVGGSGLYIDAVIKGLDEMPAIPEELRQSIIHQVAKEGLTPLVHELKEKDPDYFQSVDTSNTQRVVRAIEVIRHTGRPFSSFRQQKAIPRPFATCLIGITTEREELYAKIDDRVDEMVRQGLVEEAQEMYPYKQLYALQTVGYKELFDYFDGHYDLSTAIKLIKRNTRRYAKRQLTWFRRNDNIRWFQSNEQNKMIRYLQNHLDQYTY